MGNKDIEKATAYRRRKSVVIYALLVTYAMYCYLTTVNFPGELGEMGVMVRITVHILVFLAFIGICVAIEALRNHIREELQGVNLWRKARDWWNGR